MDFGKAVRDQIRFVGRDLIGEKRRPSQIRQLKNGGKDLIQQEQASAALT